MTVSYDSAFSRRSLSFATQVAPAILYTSALFYGGLIRMAALPEVGLVPTDKLLHAAAFGGLSFLLVRAARYFTPSAPVLKLLLVGGFGASALGALLEVCQAFVPYRSADPWDWVADTVGAALAVFVLFALWRLLPRRANG